jgi:hypothetical protein
LTARFGLAPVIRVAVLGFAGVTAILAVLMTLGADSLPLMMGFLFVGYGCLGVVIPTASVLALERHGAIAGTASALMGSIQLVTGAAVLAVAGLFAEGAPQPMVIGIAACGVAAFLVAQIALRRSVKVPAAAGVGLSMCSSIMESHDGCSLWGRRYSDHSSARGRTAYSRPGTARGPSRTSRLNWSRTSLHKPRLPSRAAVSRG